MRATMIPSFPGRWHVVLEDGRELLNQTQEEINELVWREKLVPWSNAGADVEPNMGGRHVRNADWFLD